MASKSQMKILLLLSCFAFAFAGAFKSNAQTIPDVDICALFDSYDKYEGRTISSTALMTYSTVGRVDGGDSVLYSLKCNNPDYFATVSGGSSKTWKFLTDLKPESNFILEIEFVGRIKIGETLGFGHLGWTRAEVNIQRVKSSKVLTTEAKPNWPNHKAAAPLTARAKKVDIDGKVFLQSLYIQPKRMKDDISLLLSDDFVFKKNDGKSLSKDEYLNRDYPIIASWKGGWTSLGMSEVKRTKQGLSALGTVAIDVNTKDKQTFICRLSFILKDGFWVISSAQLED